MFLRVIYQAPVVKGISRRPPEPEVGVRIPAGAPFTRSNLIKGLLFLFLYAPT